MKNSSMSERTLLFLGFERRLGFRKNRLKAERAWFLSRGEENEAGNRAGFDSLGQKNLSCEGLWNEKPLED